jgi:hypothetical protein
MTQRLQLLELRIKNVSDGSCRLYLAVYCIQTNDICSRADWAVLLHTLRAGQRADFVSSDDANNAARFDLKLAAE